MQFFLLFILSPHFCDMSVSTCMLSLASCSDCIIIIPSSAKKSATILQMFVSILFRQSYIFSIMRYVTNKKRLLEQLHPCLIHSDIHVCLMHVIEVYVCLVLFIYMCYCVNYFWMDYVLFKPLYKCISLD